MRLLFFPLVFVFWSQLAAAQAFHHVQCYGQTLETRSTLVIALDNQGLPLEQRQLCWSKQAHPDLYDRQKQERYMRLLDFIAMPAFQSGLDFLVFYSAPDDGILASVVQLPGEEAPYALAVNLYNLYGDGDWLDYATMVHEYAHLISFNPLQYDHDPDNLLFAEDGLSGPAYRELYNQALRDCGGRYASWEGCAAEDSYMNLFFQAFWRKEVRNHPAFMNQAWDFRAIDEYYYANAGDFVSSYAATNVEEDFAESFAAWISQDPRQFDLDSPGARRKMDFFAGFEELVAYRERLQAAYAVFRQEEGLP